MKIDNLVLNADFYVSVEGDDSADGSLKHPYRTLERAAQAAREAKNYQNGVRIGVMAGEYNISCFELSQQDSGNEDGPIEYTAFGDGEVVLNGGVTLKSDDFIPIGDEIRERLHGEDRDKTLVIDLKKYNLTADDWGELSPIGSFGTENKYDSYHPDANCELFANGKRMTLARYPSGSDFLKLSAVADVGDCHEFPEQNYYFDWDERRNHRAGAYIMDKQTTARIAGWKNTRGIWAYGFFYHDWADSSTPVKGFDLEHRTMYPEYVSRYGARKDAIYYFYNVLDELDTPGEWYLDRENGLLYFYPPEDIRNLRVEMTISRRSVIYAKDLAYTTFRGFTVKGTRADAITIFGHDNRLEDLTISGVMGNAVVIHGENNVVTGCDISHTGRGGIMLEGGNRVTLTPGHNIADNNCIHDWAEVYLMYNGGVRLDGVGNICSHNEFYNSPHTAIFYYGNDHVIEYNSIHEVVLLSSDAGAIYSGQDWAGQGCIVRYNYLKNIGAGEFCPDGIYFDDALSGQQAYGNILFNVKKNGFLIGGGRDNQVYNNIIIDCGTPIAYDDRARDGFINNGWMVKAVDDYEKSSMWVNLRKVPYSGALWSQRYPSLAKVKHDFEHPDDPDFAVNPSYSRVCGNLIIDAQGRVGNIAESVAHFGRVENNHVYSTLEEAGLTDEGRLKEDSRALKDMPDFRDLPIEKMGRYPR